MRFLTILSAIYLAVSALAAETNSASDEAGARYTAAIEGRTSAILKVLDLSGTNRTTRVHDIIIAQYRALNAWHNENDSKLKAAKGDTNAVTLIHWSLKALHEKFLAALAENLSPDQIEQVKDKMTYGKVEFTYTGYLNEYPGMTDSQKARVLDLLKDAREEAMDGGSSEEKTAIFTRYKGKINNYLSSQGISKPKKPKTMPASTNSPAAH